MIGLVTAIAGIGCIIAIAALWHSMKLAKQVRVLKRNEYYTNQKLNGATKEIHEAIEPLRIHLAGVASGSPVASELIRNGSLYWDVSAEEAERMMAQDPGTNSNGVVIVDVRTDREYIQRHLPGAKLIPIEELESRYKAEIPLGSEKVFVYCSMGDRSRLACDFLSRQGFGNLYNIRDGLQRWRGPTDGEPTVNLIQIQSKSKVR